MKLRIEIDLDNAAFVDDTEGEVRRILNTIPDRVEAGDHPISLRDINGNKVGYAEIEDSQ